MKMYGVDMRGKFHVQRVATLPAFSVEDKGRLIYVEDEEGFYYGGTDDWKTAGGLGKIYEGVIENDMILRAGNVYFFDTTSNSFNVFLEEDVKAGESVVVVDLAGTFTTFSVTVNRRSTDKILGQNSYVCNYDNGIYSFIKTNTAEWKVDIGGLTTSGGQSGINVIETPTIISPVSGSTNIETSPTLEASPYFNLYGKAMQTSHWQISTDPEFETVVQYIATGPVTSYTLVTPLAQNTLYYWRVRYGDIDGTFSYWSNAASFTTADAFVATPTLTVEGFPDMVPETPTLTTSAFSVVGGSDTHQLTDWEIRLAGNIV